MFMSMDIDLVPKDSSGSSAVVDERSRRRQIQAAGNEEETEDPLEKKQLEEDQLASAKAKMGEVREENQRLKMILSSIIKDYKTLQMRFFDIVQKKESMTATTETTFATATPNSSNDGEETELISLSLGTHRNSVATSEKSEKMMNCVWEMENNGDNHLKEDLHIRSLETTEIRQDDRNTPDRFEEPKSEDLAVDSRKMSKKTCRSAEDDQPKEVDARRARVSVRATCDAPTMQDGCQWRKYGQKTAKGNPCPRAYYRCTLASSCPVRKQVQRCADDMSILITTYEGTHNHPLPIQATAMASTTSAAACMLMSGSSAPSATATSIAAGLTFDTSRNLVTKPFYITNPYFGSSSACPTITLDLTNKISPTPKFSISNPFLHPLHKYSSPSMGFTNFSFDRINQNKLPALEGACAQNANGSYFRNGLTDQFNKNPVVSSCLERSPHDELYQAYLIQKNHPFSSAPVLMQNFSETIAAATKAVTSDPKFQSAVATAMIKSIFGDKSDKFSAWNVSQNMVQTGVKWEAQFSSTKDSH